MEKEFLYKGKKYKLEMFFMGNSYHVKIDENGWFPIPLDYFNDMDKLSAFFITIIENENPLSIIEKWNGILINPN
jgi:hypothetical protein